MVDNFTPEQIEEFMQEFFTTVGRRQYIGARYVPIFGRIGEESIAWDNTAPYEPLTVVTYEGNSYTSRTYVPAGIDITNATYWALTGNYWAQIEQYRQEVAQYNGRITDLEDALPVTEFTEFNTVKKYIDDEITSVENSVNDLKDIIPDTEFDDTNTVKKYIDDEVTSVENSVSDLKDIIPATDFDDTNTVKKYIDDEITSVENSVDGLKDIIPDEAFDSINTVKKYIDDSITNIAQQGGFNIVAELDFESGGVQGCTWLYDDVFVIAVTVPNSNNVKLYRWNRIANTLSSPVTVNGYHANAITYNPDDGNLYITDCFAYDASSILIPTITIINASTFAFQERKTLPVPSGATGCYSLVYDRDEKIFYATMFRGSVLGQANRVYKYNAALDEIIGYFDLQGDYITHYTPFSSSQGVQYVKDGIIYQVWYDFGCISGHSTIDGKRLLAFNVPWFANSYRFVGELESVCVDADNNVYCFTQNGVFECGVFHTVYEDKVVSATTLPHFQSNVGVTIEYDTYSELDPKTWMQHGHPRTAQDGVNWGTINHVYTGVHPLNNDSATNARHSINMRGFVGEMSLGTKLKKPITISGSRVAIFNGTINCEPISWSGVTGCIVARNSQVFLRAVTFDPTEANDFGFSAIFGSQVILGASLTMNNGAKIGVYNGSLAAQPAGTSYTVTHNAGEVPNITVS